LYNLLSNSIKFTPPGGTIRVAATPSGTAGSVDIAVSDTGIGIGADNIPRLFVEFEQIVPAGGETVGGTGLGLALTRKLVELHGGSISVRSQPGAGSTFTVRMPVAVPASAPAPPPRTTGPAAAAAAEPVPRATILVLEDDPPSRRLVRAILARRGHDILEAGS